MIYELCKFRTVSKLQELVGKDLVLRLCNSIGIDETRKESKKFYMLEGKFRNLQIYKKTVKDNKFIDQFENEAEKTKVIETLENYLQIFGTNPEYFSEPAHLRIESESYRR